MSTQLACERKHSQAWLLWVQTLRPYGNVRVVKVQRHAATTASNTSNKEWDEPRHFLKDKVCRRRSPKESRLTMFTEDKLLTPPYTWQGQWMWFSMTQTYQNSLTMTGVSRCDFDTSQYHSRCDGACLPDSQQGQRDSDDGKRRRRST